MKNIRKSSVNVNNVKTRSHCFFKILIMYLSILINKYQMMCVRINKY